MKKLLLSIFLSISLIANCWAGIDFDGIDDGIDTTDIANVEGALTISAWINVDDLTNGYVILAKYHSTNSLKSWLFRINSTSELAFYTYNGSAQAVIASTNTISSDTWTHILMTFDGTAGTDKVDFYINGALCTLNATNDDTYVPANTATVITMGRWASATGFNDGISTEEAIWNVELTTAQIAQLASSRIKGMPLQIQSTALKGYWSMDDQETGTSADGDTVRDLSGNGNNGTGVDGANNTGLLWTGESILSYTPNPIMWN